MREIVLALDRGVNRLAVAASAWALGAAATLALFQVITRFVLQQPSTWSEALMRILLIWMVYLGSAGLFRRGTLISMDLLERHLTGRKRLILQAFGGLASVVLLAVLLWYGIGMAYRVRHQMISSLEVSIVWGYAAIPIGAAISLIAVAARWLDPDRNT